MGDRSQIQWTDATWIVATGCTRVSAGCDNCYAFALHDQRHVAWKRGRWPGAPAQYHLPFSRVQPLPARLADPLRWRKPRRVFVTSMGDLFHPDVPDEYLRRVFAVMVATPRHTYQVLTKRPGRMRDFLLGELREAAPDSALAEHLMGDLAHIWVGTSVEDQAAAEERVPVLLEVPARVRFLSCEPVLGPLDLGPWLGPGHVNWVIAGGESGPRARPLDVGWARALRDQCRAAGVPYFFKQHGGRTAKAGGRVLDGRTWDEMPAMPEMPAMAAIPE